MMTHTCRHSALPLLVIWLMYRVGFCLSPNCSMADGYVSQLAVFTKADAFYIYYYFDAAGWPSQIKDGRNGVIAENWVKS